MSRALIAHSVRRQVEAHPRIVLATAAAFCLLALVAGLARLGVRTVDRWGLFVGQNIHLIVYLTDEVDRQRASDLSEIIGRVPSVARVSMVEPGQALAKLQASAQAFGSDGKVLESLEPAYFPRSLEVSLSPTPDLAERANDLARRLRGVPGIAEVDAMTSGLARLAVWVNVGHTLGVGIVTALGLVSLLALVAVFLRSRHGVARRALVLVQLGETPAGIRLPSSLWTALAALAGGSMGAVVFSFAWQPLLVRLERTLGIVTALPLPPLSTSEVAAGLAVIAIAGLTMGYFAPPLPRSSDHA
jgi:cell division protein FtsX